MAAALFGSAPISRYVLPSMRIRLTSEWSCPRPVFRGRVVQMVGFRPDAEKRIVRDQGNRGRAKIAAGRDRLAALNRKECRSKQRNGSFGDTGHGENPLVWFGGCWKDMITQLPDIHNKVRFQFSHTMPLVTTLRVVTHWMGRSASPRLYDEPFLASGNTSIGVPPLGVFLQFSGQNRDSNGRTLSPNLSRICLRLSHFSLILSRFLLSSSRFRSTLSAADRKAGKRNVGVRSSSTKTQSVELVVTCLLIMSYASRKTANTRLRGVYAPSRRSRYSARRLRRVNQRRRCNPVSPVHRAPASRAGKSRVNAADITKPMAEGTKPRSFPTRRKRQAEYAFGGKPDESGSVLRRLATNPRDSINPYKYTSYD